MYTWSGYTWQLTGNVAATFFETTAGFPATGNVNYLYCASDTGRVYRWAGAAYIEIGPLSGAASDSRWDLLLPAAPTGLTVANGNAQATLSWTAPTGVIAQAPVSDYVVQFSSNSGSSWSTFSDGSSTATSATVTGLANGTAYTFRVAAVNAVGTGAYTAASAAVTPFAPTSVAGLQLWLDASDAGSLFSATTGGSLVAADGGVARWQDKSGNGYHFTKPSGSNFPLRKSSVRNGLGAVRYVASDGSLTVHPGNTASYTRMLNTSFSLAPPFTVFFCGNPTYSEGSQHNGTLLTSYNTTYGSGLYAFGTDASETPKNIIYTYSTSRAFTARAPMLLTGVVSSSTTTGYRNGTSAVTASTSSSGFDGASLGAIRGNPEPVDASYFLLGDIYEVIIFNVALSDTDRSAVDQYLISKWAIT